MENALNEWGPPSDTQTLLAEKNPDTFQGIRGFAAPRYSNVPSLLTRSG